MPDQEIITYTCQRCGWENTWTRAEILQFGEKVIYKDAAPDEDHYSLPCRNRALRPPCEGRDVVAVKRKEG